MHPTTSIITTYPVIMSDGTKKHQLISINSQTGIHVFDISPLDTDFKASDLAQALISTGIILKPATYCSSKTFIYTIKRDGDLFTPLKIPLFNGVLKPAVPGMPQRTFNGAAFRALTSLEHHMNQENSQFISDYYIPDEA